MSAVAAEARSPNRMVPGDGADPRALRDCFGAFLTGVTVVSAVSPSGERVGFTANSFTSVSLDPPLVLVCVKSGAEGSGHVDQNGVFAVNILAADQEALSRHFASKDRPRGRDAFRGIGHRTSVTGSPVLDGVVGYLDCRLHERHTVGDHEILIGEVLALESTDREPLLFHRGGYRLLRAP